MAWPGLPRPLFLCPVHPGSPRLTSLLPLPACNAQVYVIEVEWSDGSKVVIYRRYSQFFEFHTSLLDLFPKDAGENPGEQPRIIPFLPGALVPLGAGVQRRG